MLEPDGDGFRLTGHKRWATLSTLADVLLVVARTGADEAGRPVLRVARVPPAREGVALRPMPEAPFAPEIPHAEVGFDRVRVSEGELLPGDGYDAYLKPFRTIEDLHVHAAVIGLVIGMARRHGWPQSFLEDALAAAALVRALAREPPGEPAVHVALAGAIRSAAALVASITPLWREADGDERARWERDAGLLAVASNARAARALAAWRRLGGG